VLTIQVLVRRRHGGPRHILGAVTEPDVVRRRLAMLGQATDPPPDCSARPTDPRSIKPHPGAAGPVCPALRGTRPGPPSGDRRPACRPRRGRAMVLAAAEGARPEVTGGGTRGPRNVP